MTGPATGQAPWPHFPPDEVARAAEVLASGRVNYWTGPEGRSFEQEYADVLGVRHVLALANGTVALELALRALGIGSGDDVVVPSRTFIATAAAVVAVGARPVCADVDRISGCLTVETAEQVRTDRTRAVIVVHLGGWPADVDALVEWGVPHAVQVVEDCAQAHGATLRGRPVGTLGAAGAFSFCQDKILSTAGEGGLLALTDDAAWDAAWSYRDHGKDRELVADPHPAPGFRWLNISFGSNFRMTEVQSAIGRLQLAKLPSWTAQRQAHAAVLTGAVEGLAGLRVPASPVGSEHAYYRWYSYVEPAALKPGWTRDRVLAELCDRGVPAFSGSCSEIYREFAFPSALRPERPHPVARELGETSVALLVHPTLTAAQIDRNSEVLRSVVSQATR